MAVPDEQPDDGDTAARWADLTPDALAKVARLLEPRGLASARLACRSWRAGLSLGVSSLRPRLDTSALRLQSWARRMQAAFPALRELDLRQLAPAREHAPFFAALPLLARVRVSSHGRPRQPAALLAELRGLAAALQASHPRAALECELRLGEAGPYGRDPARGDPAADLGALAALPPNVQVTALHMPQLCCPAPAAGLAAVARLGQLRQLTHIAYGARLTDGEFAALAGLARLEQLSFGVLPLVSDAGLLAGLRGLTRLRELFLFDVGSVTDAGVTALAASLARLEAASLSKCRRLTDRSLDCLARLPRLQRLTVSENDLMSAAAAGRFSCGGRSLTLRQCPGVACAGQ